MGKPKMTKRGDHEYYMVVTYLSESEGARFEKFMKDNQFRKKSEAAYKLIMNGLNKNFEKGGKEK